MPVVAVFALGSALYWAAVWVVAGVQGFPLDDAYIHLQFARNLLDRGEMAFNAGTPSAGCTAPGFAALVAVARRVVPNWLHASFLVTTVASLGTAVWTCLILRRWTGDSAIARWGGIVVALASPTVIQAFSGMEAGVYCCACLLAIAAYGGGRSGRIAGATILAFCVWFRPEFLVGFPLLAGEWAWRRWSRADGGQKATFVELLLVAAVWLGMGTAYAGYHYRLGGDYVPTTFTAKAVAHFALKPHWMEGVPAVARHGNWEYLPLALVVLPIVNLLVMGVGLFTVCAPMAFGLEESARRLWRVNSAAGAGWRLAVLLLFGYPIARAFVDPTGTLWYQGQRYFAHLTPLFVLVVFGAWPLTRSLVAASRWDWTRRSFRAQARQAAAWAACGSLVTGAFAVLSVRNIDQMQVRTARWLRENSAPEDVIATNDIGAIGFYSERRILDTVGLVEPDIIDHYLTGGDLSAYVAAREPRYVVLFPEWYPRLTALGEALNRRRSFTTSPNVVCGGDELVVYEPNWPRLRAMLGRNALTAMVDGSE